MQKQLDFRFVRVADASRITQLTPSNLKKIRLEPNSPLVEGLHYKRVNSRTIVYCRALIEHWAAHRYEPIVHLNWCDRIAPLLEAHKSGLTA
jgi:hypothetical protein